MLSKIVAIGFVIAGLCLALASDAQEKKTGKGTVIGELKSTKNTPDGKNTLIEVLARGDDKARRYHVQYDEKIKGPMPKVLHTVRGAKVGDTVELQWVGTSHGPAITSFKVVKKGDGATK